MGFTTIAEKAHELFSEAPFIAHIDNDGDYQQALALMDVLIDDYDGNRVLIDMLSTSIEHWEDRASEFADFNNRVAGLDDVAVLKVLMEQYGLGIADLPEIGSKSLISKILNGRERHLTRKHIQALSQRFAVSPALFFQQH